MKLYPAPLDDNIFGKTYFVTTTVTVYKDDSYFETEGITVPPGTMLVNPDVFFITILSCPCFTGTIRLSAFPGSRILT